ncbi:MAG: creatininase family protein, partial [Oscillospiraceae bacterium]|nr:creatininase family protein [Oscillospiraceae bacterium]
MEKIHKNFMVNMTVKDMQQALEKTKTVIIPVGVVEQHGYHLPLSVDIHNAEQPLKRAGERLNAVVAPTVNYCFSGGELTGTVNVSPQVFGLYMMDICCEFVRMGFKNI